MRNFKSVFAVASMAVAMFSACASGEQKALTVSGLAEGIDGIGS